jgi:ribosome-associated toxin RatA of RatAB toxin-antitoxin module
MAVIDLRTEIAAGQDLVYATVADVERYPEFLPGVMAVERSSDLVTMALRIGVFRVASR